MKNIVFCNLYILLNLLTYTNINQEYISENKFDCCRNQICFQKTSQNQLHFICIDSFSVIKNNCKSGAVNQYGDTILPIEFYDIQLIKKNIAIVKRSYFWESVDLTSLKFKTLEYNFIGNFSQKSNWKAPFYRDSLIGIIDTNFNEIIINDCIELSDFNDGIAIYETIYGEGIIDQSGVKKTKAIYSDLINIGSGHSFFIRDQFYGILDQNGNEIFKYQSNVPFLEVYTTYYDSTQFLIELSNDSTITSSGELLKIDNIYDYLYRDFKNTFLNHNDRIYNVTINNVFVENNNRSSVYDKQGNLIISMENVSITPLALATFDELNNQIIPTLINSKVYIVETKSHKNGLLKDNNFVLDTIYDDVFYINWNLIGAKLNGKNALCDKFGNFLLQFNYDFPISNKGYFYKIIDNSNSNKVGFYNQNGEIFIPTIYEDGIELNDEIFALKSNKKWGILDTYGEIIIPFQYDSIVSFGMNRILVQRNGLWGIINEKGSIIIPIHYDKIEQFDSGLFMVYKNNFLWFVDYDGTILSEKISDNGSITRSKMILGSWYFPENNIKILKHGKFYEIQFSLN